jgi:hypothetical protein
MWPLIRLCPALTLPFLLFFIGPTPLLPLFTVGMPPAGRRGVTLPTDAAGTSKLQQVPLGGGGGDGGGG